MVNLTWTHVRSCTRVSFTSIGCIWPGLLHPECSLPTLVWIATNSVYQYLYTTMTAIMVKRYKKWVHEQRLKSMVNHPTRVTKNSRTCIDHILTNRLDLYHNAATFDPGLHLTKKNTYHVPSHMSLADHIVILTKTNFDYFSQIKIGLKLQVVWM